MFRTWWLGALAAALALVLGLLLVEFSRLESSKPVNAFRDCLDCPEMVVVPPGAYTMGSPSSEKGRFQNEGPQHHVVIAHPLAVGKYEVTHAEFARFVADTAYTPQDVCTYWTGSNWESSSRYNWKNPGFSQTPSDPVVCVTWNDAKTYVDWLSKKTGKRYRLLSEAEWEYVSRASTTTIRPWGDGLTRNDANYGSNECCQPRAKKRDQWGYTAPVGSFAPNRFGLYDIMGNVWEWVEDCWNKKYVGAPDDGSAWQSGDCGTRVVRGGSWYSDPRRVRSAVRYTFDTGVNRTKVGFRVARSL